MIQWGNEGQQLSVYFVTLNRLMNSDSSCFHPHQFLSSNLKCHFNARVCPHKCHSAKHKNCYDNLIQIQHLKTQYRLKLMKENDKMQELIAQIHKIYSNKVDELERSKEKAISEIEKIFQNGRKEHLRTVRCDEVTLQILENNRLDRITCDMVYKIREFTKLQFFNFTKRGLNIVQKFHRGYKQRIRNKGKSLSNNPDYRKHRDVSSEEVSEVHIKEQKEFEMEKKVRDQFQWAWVVHGSEYNPIDLSD